MYVNGQFSQRIKISGHYDNRDILGRFTTRKPVNYKKETKKEITLETQSKILKYFVISTSILMIIVVLS